MASIVSVSSYKTNTSLRSCRDRALLCCLICWSTWWRWLSNGDVKCGLCVLHCVFRKNRCHWHCIVVSVGTFNVRVLTELAVSESGIARVGRRDSECALVFAVLYSRR